MARHASPSAVGREGLHLSGGGDGGHVIIERAASRRRRLGLPRPAHGSAVFKVGPDIDPAVLARERAHAERAARHYGQHVQGCVSCYAAQRLTNELG